MKTTNAVVAIGIEVKNICEDEKQFHCENFETVISNIFLDFSLFT